MSDVTAVEPRPRWRPSRIQGLLICFVVAFLLALSRRHDPWYPYAEDGSVFYQQANFLGLRSLFVPDGGYLHVGLRIMALFLAQFPPSLMPFAMVTAALAIQAAVATYIFSEEISNLVPSQFHRGLLAFIYIGLPDVDEVYGHFVNAQWHLAILSTLLIFGRVPATRAGKVVRLALVAILSLTGPFVAFLLPLTAYKLFRSRSRYNLGLMLCSLPCLVQVGSVFVSDRPTRTADFLLRPLLMPRVFGGRGLLSAAIAPSLFEQHYVDAPVLWAATFGAVVLTLYAILERKRFAVLLLYMGACILVSCLRVGVGNVSGLVDPKFSNRYFFIFGFGLLATVVLMVASEKRRVQAATACCIAAMLAVSWQLPYPVGFWPKYQAALQRYDRAKPGTQVVFPEVPKGWIFFVRKR
jgi:hypothetical protein